MSVKAPRPLRGNVRGWMVRGGDGLFHATPNERKRKKRKVYDIERPDMECCEHCPYSDCKRQSATPCLSVITYKEYIEVTKLLLRKAAEMEIADLLDDVGICRNTFTRFIRGGWYPSKETQVKLKAYLEKEKGE